MIAFILRILAFFRVPPVVVPPEPPPAPPPPPPPPPPPLPQDSLNNKTLYGLAYSCLDMDIARTQDELGCAEAVSYILLKAKVPNFPPKGFLGTAELYKWLEGHFELITDPVPGDIVISPTGTGSGALAHGHVGILGKHQIMSNNSMSGLFDAYYTLASWEKRYTQVGKMPTLFYRWV